MPTTSAMRGRDTKIFAERRTAALRADVLDGLAVIDDDDLRSALPAGRPPPCVHRAERIVGGVRDHRLRRLLAGCARPGGVERQILAERHDATGAAVGARQSAGAGAAAAPPFFRPRRCLSSLMSRLPAFLSCAQCRSSRGATLYESGAATVKDARELARLHPRCLRSTTLPQVVNSWSHLAIPVGAVSDGIWVVSHRDSTKKRWPIGCRVNRWAASRVRAV